ncbi:hypothetical protein Poly41_52730 [Novipirellula artificiosorum]|uniref:Uncharacterized protein n=1 Tax=Novipirellula artificiosorum TaxID=2528016 RepID=A0A5C6D9P8_9BACT|nr:hypothetical protein Poly41_52730 [Novipirellula artificiosorum]
MRKKAKQAKNEALARACSTLSMIGCFDRISYRKKRFKQKPERFTEAFPLTKLATRALCATLAALTVLIGPISRCFDRKPAFQINICWKNFSSQGPEFTSRGQDCQGPLSPLHAHFDAIGQNATGDAILAFTYSTSSARQTK